MCAYDKAKYHDDFVEEAGLPDEHAENHTVCFLRWLIENNLMSPEFLSQSNSPLDGYRAGKESIHSVYRWWDRCLHESMLSDHGNAFATAYYGLGTYDNDYSEMLRGTLPSELHVTYSEENYHRLKPRIDQRYREWSAALEPMTLWRSAATNCDPTQPGTLKLGPT